jgi:hypothetical protein
LLEQNNISFSSSYSELIKLAAQFNIESETRKKNEELIKYQIADQISLMQTGKDLKTIELEKNAEALRQIEIETNKAFNQELLEEVAVSYEDIGVKMNEAFAVFSTMDDVDAYFTKAIGGSEALATSLMDSASAFGESMGQMLASGMNFFDALGKAALGTLIDYIQKQILMEAPAILSKFVSMMGPFGIPAGLAAIGLVSGLLSAAKSQVGAETGYMEGIKQVGKKGVTDSKMIWFNPKEVIIPEPMVNKNRDMLAAMFNGTNPEIYYKQKFEKENTNTNFVPVKTSNSINANFTHSFKDVKVKGSDLYISIDKIKRKEMIRG